MTLEKFYEMTCKVLSDEYLADKDKVKILTTFGECVDDEEKEAVLEAFSKVEKIRLTYDKVNKKEVEIDIQVGDYVLVKEWDEMLEVEGSYIDEEGDIIFGDIDFSFVSMMKYLCGKYVQVVDIVDSSCDSKREYIVDEDWYLTAEMIKEVMSAKPDEVKK